jgi:phosphatidate cytidylyltransferase
LIRARLITGALFGGVLISAVLLLPTPLAAIVLGVLWILGAWEWAGLARLTGGARLVYAAACAVCMLCLYLFADSRALYALVTVALAGLLLAFVAVLTYPRKFGMGTVGAAGFVALVPCWVLLVRLHGEPWLGPVLALTALAIVWAADIGAYTFGRAFGRIKLAPAVSPGKTWEGVTGGLISAAVAAWVAAILIGLPAGALLALGIVTALASVVGDLAVSVFKRNVGLKDTGTLLPGHGGVMDRIDSLTAAIPVFVLGLMLARIVA